MAFALKESKAMVLKTAGTGARVKTVATKHPIKFCVLHGDTYRPLKKS